MRQRYGHSQKSAAEAAGTTQQTWQRYESGDNDALLNEGKRLRAIRALGSTAEEFAMDLAAVDAGLPLGAPMAPPGLADRGRVYEFPIIGRVRAGPQGMQVYDDGITETIDLSPLLGDDVRFLRNAGESMLPYVEPGGFTTYNVRKSPRRGRGCVIEMESGEFFVKRYERIEGDKLIVTELFPKERELTFDLADVKGVYPVGIRGD